MDKEYVVYVLTMKYYSAMRKKDILPFATTWMDLVHPFGTKYRHLH